MAHYKKYTLSDGVVRTEYKKLKRFAIGLVASIGLTGAFAFPALAASNDYCGSSVNGCTQSMSNTPCAGHGAFGAFGKDNNLAGGADGYQTGLNNALLCGNRQGNL